MGPVLFDDLVTLARVLMPLDAADQPTLAQTIIARAGVAYLWSRTVGGVHPVWGAGTLSDACAGLPRAAHPRAADPKFRAALVIACQAVDAAYPEAQEMQVGKAGS